MLDPGMLDPGMIDPGMLDPGMLDPGMVDAGMVDPGTVDPSAPNDGCGCNPLGTLEEMLGICDATSGQCHCKCACTGLTCDQCADFHYGFPNCEDNCKYLLLNGRFLTSIYNLTFCRL